MYVYQGIERGSFFASTTKPPPWSSFLAMAFILTEMSTFLLFVSLARMRLNVDPKFVADCASTPGQDGAPASTTIFQAPSTTVNHSGMPPGVSASKFQAFSEVCAASAAEHSQKTMHVMNRLIIVSFAS